MFMKSANSEIGIGIHNNSKMSPQKYSCKAETGNWKRQLLKGTSLTRP